MIYGIEIKSINQTINGEKISSATTYAFLESVITNDGYKREIKRNKQKEEEE
jgi:hypothetical protein